MGRSDTKATAKRRRGWSGTSSGELMIRFCPTMAPTAPGSSCLPWPSAARCRRLSRVRVYFHHHRDCHHCYHKHYHSALSSGVSQDENNLHLLHRRRGVEMGSPRRSRRHLRYLPRAVRGHVPKVQISGPGVSYQLAKPPTPIYLPRKAFFVRS